jgi:hypothetical protein
MRILARTLFMLAAAYALGAVLAASASAGELEVDASISGAGAIVQGGAGWCLVSPSEDPHPTLACQRRTRRTLSDTSPGYWISLQAQPAAGWRFEGWSGCPTVVDGRCDLWVPSGDGTINVRPLAKFADDAAPTVTNLTAVASPTREGRFEVTWGDSEPGVKYTCKLGGRTRTCTSPMTVDLPLGTHPFEVHAKDPSDKKGDASIDLVVLDTALAVAPAEGARVRTAEPQFVATTVDGEHIECSLDGAPYVLCGYSIRGRAPLVLSALGDGAHTLRVRSRLGDWIDFTPVVRTFTVDTTPPRSTPSVSSVAHDSPLAAAGEAQPPAAASSGEVAQPERVAFALNYRFRSGRFTRFAVTGTEPGAKVRVKVTRPRERAVTMTVQRLVGRRLPNGTKLIVRAGAESRKLTIRRGRVIA